METPGTATGTVGTGGATADRSATRPFAECWSTRSVRDRSRPNGDPAYVVGDTRRPSSGRCRLSREPIARPQTRPCRPDERSAVDGVYPPSFRSSITTVTVHVTVVRWPEPRSGNGERRLYAQVRISRTCRRRASLVLVMKHTKHTKQRRGGNQAEPVSTVGPRADHLCRLSRRSHLLYRTARPPVARGRRCAGPSCSSPRRPSRRRRSPRPCPPPSPARTR